MAEQVNQRIEDMINELEQMRRTTLYNDEEIKEISRKRKEFEYHIQRHVKQKEDYVQYIAYELSLLEDISSRRKMANLTEKKKDIEYAIAHRLNKVFKQFIYRFQNEVEIYFEYLKFCKSVGFKTAASGIIGQMLQMHGDKPKMWQLASKWETEEHDNLEVARGFLLKGLQRHPDAEEKLLKRADVVWRNGLKNVNGVSLLFNCLDLVLKYEVEGDMRNSIKKEIWARKDHKDVWTYIAEKELEGCHWEVIEEFVEKSTKFPKVVNNCIGVYEEALIQFPDEKLCTKYIHTLLKLDDSICDDSQKISAVKQAWWSGYGSDLLTNEMFAFGIEMLKMEDEASNKNSKLRCVWEEKLLLSKPNENKMMAVLQDAIKVLKAEDSIYLYNLMIDNVESNVTFKKLLKKFQSCENNILLAVKPKLLQKMYDHNGLKAARDLYEELIRMPPIQLEVDTVMINIEKLQEKLNAKQIRRCYECAIQHHGTNVVDIWNDYIEFEIVTGDPLLAPPLYRRALGMLKKELVDAFVIKQCMHRAN
ncbi:U3 small nucleolar RNA-associated protein 6-like protein [Operophtera brumata]|uniref:U3 small nucleolar RNA-associated protein 6-like protein n=1 Tax=Operophtera brumata TaxID=104452 RepID=A0A0L7LAS7_OPEBR|nr:U3 small nucleolar RNA-associated protein 6-like protein [Operophtera brumata]